MYVKFITINVNCLNPLLFDFGDYDWKAVFAFKMTVAMYQMCCQRLVLDGDTAVYRLHNSNEKWSLMGASEGRIKLHMRV